MKKKKLSSADDILTLVMGDWQKAEEQRSAPYRHLNGRSLQKFWRDSRDQFNGFDPGADSVEAEWKSRIFRRKTKHKVIATVASLLSTGLGIDFLATDPDDNFDRAVSDLAEDLYEWSTEKELFDQKKLNAYLEMVVSGTVHLYEEIAWDTRTVKEVDDIDFLTGKVTWKEKEFTEFKGCRSEVVPNDEMYPGDVWEPDVQEQPFLIRRFVTSSSVAEKRLGRFAKWKDVVPGASFFLTPSTDTGGKEEDESAGDDRVEVVMYWNKPMDLFAIVANKVLLTDPEHPFPYPHKQYPFVKGIFEPFADARFYFGESLPNKSIDEQELINELTRMFVDSTKLKNKPPLFVTNPDMMGTDLVVPGSVNPKDVEDSVDTIPQVTQGVSPSEFNMLALIERQMDENSIDPLLAGKQAAGDPTATEIRAIAGSADRIKGFNDLFVGTLLIQHASLRIANVLWFLTKDDEYKQVVIDDVKVASGKNGRRKIVFEARDLIPPVKDLLKAEAELEARGEPTDFLYVDRDSIRDYAFHVKISATPKPKKNSANYLLKVMQKYNLYAQNPLIDQEANLATLVTAFGDDPSEMIKGAPSAPEGMPLPPKVDSAMTTALATSEAL